MELSIIETILIKRRRDYLLDAIQEQLWALDVSAKGLAKEEAQDFAYSLGNKIRELQIYNRIIDKNTKYNAAGLVNG